MKIETAVGLFVAVAFGIFFYMTFQAGFLRLDHNKYQKYAICFADAAGLCKKADVKIFGIKVGWVDSLVLKSDEQQVCATVMILKECVLYRNAYAVVRQESILGNKYLDIVPGTCAIGVLEPGKECVRAAAEGASLESLLGQVKSSVSQVEHVASSVRQVCTPENALLMQDIMQQLKEVSRSLTSVAQTVNRVVERNEQSLEKALTTVGELAQEIKDLTHKLTPVLEHTIERVTDSIDTNLTKVAQKCASVSEQVEEVARSINQGDGFVGKLIHDKDMGNDLVGAVKETRNAFSSLREMVLVNDTHVEAMLGPVEHTHFKDFKTYLDVRLYPTPNYFYLGGIVGRQSGVILREDIRRKSLHESHALATSGNTTEFVHTDLKHDVKRIFDQWLWNLQFGTVWGRYALRGGLFESTLGVGIDVDMPLGNDKCSWLTTFEAYDFRGRLRIGDERPHLKWLNRLSLGPYLYFVFGVDDFVSKCNSNAFLGVGVRFDTDDLFSLLSPVVADVAL